MLYVNLSKLYNTDPTSFLVFRNNVELQWEDCNILQYNGWNGCQNLEEWTSWNDCQKCSNQFLKAQKRFRKCKDKDNHPEIEG